MAQVTKILAHNFWKLVENDKHINSTVGEEAQLVYAWLCWQKAKSEGMIRDGEDGIALIQSLVNEQLPQKDDS
jgi:hypothetical protein